MPDRDISEGKTACYNNCPFAYRCKEGWTYKLDRCRSEVDRIAIILQSIFPNERISIITDGVEGIQLARGTPAVGFIMLNDGVWKKVT